MCLALEIQQLYLFINFLSKRETVWAVSLILN